jgi:hypothetical protein
MRYPWLKTVQTAVSVPAFGTTSIPL